MIVIAIIGIIASIAMPQYEKFSKRSRFTEIILATAEFKTPAEIAVQTGAATVATDLNSGQFGIPDPRDASTDHKPVSAYIQSIGMTNGVITAVSTMQDASNDAYNYLVNAVITNVGTSNGLRWEVDASSTCVTDGVCAVVR